MADILHLDLSTGASGDKLLGALLELGEKQGLVTFDGLAGKARELIPAIEVRRESAMRGGIAATHITVHENPAEHSSHAHRHWKGIRRLIQNAAADGIVSERTAKLAHDAFVRIAEAEAKVHGVTPDQVHFHEVGAADSIIDIVLNSYLLDLLSPTAVYATPLALGQGTVVCGHGELPVPAPATAEILVGTAIPLYASSHQGELTTPTGAALIAEFVSAFDPLPCSLPTAVGYGAGSREIPDAANVLRALLAEPAPLAGLDADNDGLLYVEGVTELECNLDHISAEAAAFACEELLLAGALDVWQEPITMKKGRLACKLVVLTKPGQAKEMARKVIELTGSLGVRSTYLERTAVPRTVVTLETPYGPVPFKAAAAGAPPSRRHWLRPEHEAVASLARRHSRPYPDLYTELQGYAEGSQKGHSV